jgi:hypothetical protein
MLVVTTYEDAVAAFRDARDRDDPRGIAHTALILKAAQDRKALVETLREAGESDYVLELAASQPLHIPRDFAAVYAEARGESMIRRFLLRLLR